MHKDGDLGVRLCGAALGAAQLDETILVDGISLASAHANFGSALSLSGDYAGAIREYSEAIQINPHDEVALNLRGIAYLKTHQYDQAILDLKQAVALVPSEPGYHLMLGVAYYRAERFDLALASMGRSIVLRPDEPVSYSIRSSIYLATDQLDNALQDANKALELKPDYGKAYYNRGMAYRSMNRHDEAIRDFMRSADLMPSVAEPLLGRGMEYLDTGKYAEALQDFEQAQHLEIEEEHQSVQFEGHGLALYFLGRYREAVTRLSEADNTDPYLALYLALAREKSGQDGLSLLVEQSKHLGLDNWPGPIVRYYIGRSDETNLFTAASHTNKKISKRFMCEAAFFVAELKYANNEEEAAKLYFGEAIAACPDVSREYFAAEARLSQM